MLLGTETDGARSQHLTTLSSTMLRETLRKSWLLRSGNDIMLLIQMESEPVAMWFGATLQHS